MSFLEKLFGNTSEKALKPLFSVVEKINALESEFASLSIETLKEKTVAFRARLTDGESIDSLLPEAFAAVREAAKRTLGQRHFDVQLVGGQILHGRGVAEMRTGEGKTLVATLPVYLNALPARGVHVVTVNDYLSRRDAVWMGQVYAALGLSVGVINHDASFVYDPGHTNLDKERDATGSFHVVHEFLRPVTRREAYMADITYGTNSEFGFDYLRDNIEYDAARLRQRGHYFAVVDEVDSILIDEARTPLIISSPTTDSEKLYVTFARLAEQLKEKEDYTVDEKHRSIALTDAGINHAEKLLGVENIYTEKGVKYVHHLETAVRAKAHFHNNKEYVVKDGEVVIVDEFTGRLQPGRRWSEGLHQAIEAKEGVSIQKESRTFASITYQNYFKMYEKLSGMTGTALTSKEEFYKVYVLDVFAVPTHRPNARKDQGDLIFRTEHGKFTAAARRVKELHAAGRPVLVGTASIDKNEIFSDYLKREGVPHQVLNAKNHEREGEIIAQAGKRGAVTIATNLAGRGVDIKLGGNPSTPAEYDEVKNKGGLYVLGTERHEARRIDNQLRGRSGRQGDPGETQFYVSLEDSLMRVFAGDLVKSMMVKLGLPEDQHIENRLITRSLETAQTKIEGFHFDARKHVLDFDNVLNVQRKTVYERRSRILCGTAEDVEAYAESLATEIDPGLRAALQEKKKAMGEESFVRSLRRLILQTNDLFWVDHLEMMDHLRGSVNLRAYGQRDPLVEYRKEGLRLFKEMEAAMKEEIAKLMPHLGAAPAEKEEALVAARPALKNETGEKIGRNDPCPCGSNKKYKNCHGKT